VLAARLQARGQKVIWHACRPPDVETNAGARLLLTLAAALALDGRHDLWSMLTANESALLKYEVPGCSVTVSLPALIKSGSTSDSSGYGPTPSIPFSECSVISMPLGM